MEGRMEGVPLFDQIAVIRVVDLHHTWAPFCISSSIPKQISKCDSVGWFVMGAPHMGLSRDGIFRAIGRDSMAEDGSFLIVGQGLYDRADDVPFAEPYLAEGIDDIEFPPKLTRLGGGRMTIRHFSARIDVTSPTDCETKLVANIDPNLPLPQSLLDFVTRKICGVVLQKLQVAAKKIAKDPVRNPHSRRMRQEEQFYEGWLLPKFRAFCEISDWTMPKVSALELTEEELEREFEFQVRTKSCNAVTHNDDASTSTLSALTLTSSVTKNPISRFFREAEAKAEAKKVLRIAAARHRVENRLKAKHLSEDQMIRLEELKEAKERRMLNKGVPYAVIEVGKVNATVPTSTWFVSQIQEHSWRTRLLTTASSCCVMTIVLNPDVIFSDLLDAFDVSHATWWSDLLVDVFAVLYIALCTLLHFIVCDVAMLYAFGALDIGMKTGKLSKKYYSDTVRLVVAAMSCPMAAFSVGKAIASTLMRAFVWNGMRGIEVSKELLASFGTLLRGFVPTIILDFPGHVMSLCSGVANRVVYDVFRIVHLVFALLSAIFIKSNPFGRLFESVFLLTLKFAAALYSRWGAYQVHVRAIYEDTDIVPCWRRDAVETTRVLLTYTMVFLLSILILFDASSRANKRMNKQWDAVVSYSTRKLMQKTTPGEAFTTSERSTRSGASSMGEDYSVSVIPEPPSPIGADTMQARLKLQIRRKATRATEQSAPRS